MRFAKQRKWRRKQPTFAEYLARMPNVGRDRDFARVQLSTTDQQCFAQALLPPQQPSPSLARAFARRDAWFREQVQASIDDPRPSVPDDEARTRFAARRAALRQRAR